MTATAPKPIAAKPRILGSWIFPEFRTLAQVFELSGKPYTEESKLDLFSENGHADYSILNPAGTGVCAYVDKEKIVADPSNLTKYLCRAYCIDSLYPTADPKLRNEIDGFLDLAYTSIKQTGARLTKLLILKNMRDSERIAKLSEEKQKYYDDEWRSEREVLLEVIIPKLEQRLDVDGDRYLTGNTLTVADLAIFNELTNALTVLKEN